MRKSFVLFAFAATGLLPGCFVRNYRPLAPLSPIEKGSMDAEQAAFDYINANMKACYQNYESAAKNSYDADKRAYQVGIIGSVVTMAFGTGAGAVSGIPALAGQQPNTVQGYISLAGGIAALGVGIATTVLVDRNTNAQLQKEADTLDAAYRALQPMSDAIATARLDYSDKKLQLTQELKNAGPTPSAEAQKKIQEKAKAANDASTDLIAKFEVLLKASGQCRVTKGDGTADPAELITNLRTAYDQQLAP